MPIPKIPDQDLMAAKQMVVLRSGVRLTAQNAQLVHEVAFKVEQPAMA